MFTVCSTPISCAYALHVFPTITTIFLPCAGSLYFGVAHLAYYGVFGVDCAV